MCHVEYFGNRAHRIEQRIGPLDHGNVIASVVKLQARLPASIYHRLQVGILHELFIIIAGGAVLQQAIQQKGIERSHLRIVEAHGREGVDVDAAHFDIFDAGSD